MLSRICGTSAGKSAATTIVTCNGNWRTDTTFDEAVSDKEHSTFEQVMFHVKLPARNQDGKAEKVVQEAARHFEK